MRTFAEIDFFSRTVYEDRRSLSRLAGANVPAQLLRGGGAEVGLLLRKEAMQMHANAGCESGPL